MTFTISYDHHTYYSLLIVSVPFQFIFNLLQIFYYTPVPDIDPTKRRKLWTINDSKSKVKATRFHNLRCALHHNNNNYYYYTVDNALMSFRRKNLKCGRSRISYCPTQIVQFSIVRLFQSSVLEEVTERSVNFSLLSRSIATDWQINDRTVFKLVKNCFHY